MALIKFEGDSSGAIRAINSLESALGGIQKSIASANKSLGDMKGAFSSLAAVAAGGSLFQFTDSLQQMENKLRIATGSSEEFAKANQFVKDIADKTGQSLVEVGNLYAGLSQNAKKLGYDQNQVATATNAMATALQASGTGAAQAQSVLLQFSQILAKGKVNGDEFTTIMENLGGPVLDAIAKNMGITTAELMKYKEKGLVGAKDFTDALIRSMGELDGMTGKTATTLGQSLQRIQNAFGEVILKIDEATGFSQTFADVCKKISDNGENLIPVIKVLGVVVAALAIYFAPVITLVTAAAAAALYFADVLGPILKPVVDIVEAAIRGLTRTLVGVGSAMMALVNGENPFDAYSKSVEEFDSKAKKALETQTEGQKRLKDAADAAAQSTGASGQMSGITDKFNKEIMRDLLKQAEITATTNSEYQRRIEILNINKGLEYQLSDAQKQQLDNVLTQIATNKLRVQITQDLTASQIELNNLSIKDLDTRSIETAVALKRLEVGKAFTKELEQQYRQTLLNKQKLDEALETEKLRNLLSGTATSQTKSQSIATVTGVVSNYDPRLAMVVDYRTKKKAIDEAIAAEEAKNNGVMSENYKLLIDSKKFLDEQYKQQKAIADMEFANRDILNQKALMDKRIQMEVDVATARIEIANQEVLQRQAVGQAELAAEQKVADARMRQAGVTNQAIIDSVKQQMENVKMIQSGGVAGFQGMLGALDNVMSQMGATNKKAFEAHKALAITQAIISTYQAAAQAIAFPPGPPLSFIYVAGAIAAGFAQVNAIRSQQYSGRALGGAVSGNTPYIIGERGPEMFVPAGSGTVVPNSELRKGGEQTVNVTFQITANDTAGFDELLMKRRGLITQVIRDAQMERGQRLGA